MKKTTLAKPVRTRDIRAPKSRAPGPPAALTPLTTWRLRARMSQQKLALHFSVATSLVSDWENRVRTPRLEQALQLEALSGGQVPIESFGYGPGVVRLLLGFRLDLRLAQASEQAAPPPPAARRKARP